MNPDININYVLRYINRGATAAANSAHQSIKRSVDDSTRSINQQTRAQEDSRRATNQAAAATRTATRATSEHSRTSARNTREVDRSASSFLRLGGSINQANSRFMFLRNTMRLLKWPALIAGAGLAAQALGAVAGGAVALTSALAPLSGALIAYPAVIGAVVQALGTFKLATGGIADVVKGMADEQLRAGQNATAMADQTRAAADQVRSAEESLANAKRASKQAEDELMAAREAARRQLVDMRLAAEGAAIGEQRAQQQLRDAERNLAQAQAKGAGSREIRDLTLSVKEAELGLQQARVESTRSQKDLNEAEREGVRGSDQVTQARQQVADANRQVVDAERQLADAQRASSQAMAGSTSAAQMLQAQMDQLPQSAQNFAKYLFSLKPRLDDLRKTAADGLLPGAESGIRSALKNLPVVNRIVDITARTLGRAAARGGEFLGSRGFGRDLEKVGTTNARTIGRMADAGMYLTSALRHVLVAGRPFINWLSRGTESMAKAIDETARLNRENGDTARFFDRTQHVMEVVWDMGKNLVSAFRDIGQAARPLGNDILRDLDQASRDFAKWTSSASGQNELRKYFEDVKPGLYEVGRLVRDLTVWFFKLSRQRGLADMTESIRKDLLPALAHVIQRTTAAFGPSLVRAISTVARLIANLSGSTGPLVIFVDTLNAMAKAFNWVLDRDPAIKTMVTTIASLVAISKALKFAGAITGIRAMFGGMTKLAASTRAATVAQEQLNMAQQQGMMTGAGRGFVPWGQPIPPVNTTVRGAPGTAVGVGQTGILANTRATYAASRAVGAGRLASMGTAAKFGLGAVGRFAGPLALGLGALSFGTGFIGTSGRNMGLDDRIQGGLSGLTMGLLEAPKSMAELRNEGAKAAREAIQGERGIKAVQEAREDVQVKLNQLSQVDGAWAEDIRAQLRGQLDELNKQVKARRELAQQRDIKTAAELGGTGPESYQRLFETMVKSGRSAEESIDKVTKQMLGKLGKLRSEGSADLGGMYLDMLRQQAKSHPELRDNVREVTRQMEDRWRSTGKDIRIINGQVVRSTPELWDRMYDRLDTRTEKWKERQQASFTAVQRRLFRMYTEFDRLDRYSARLAIKLQERGLSAPIAETIAAVRGVTDNRRNPPPVSPGRNAPGNNPNRVGNDVPRRGDVGGANKKEEADNERHVKNTKRQYDDLRKSMADTNKRIADDGRDRFNDLRKDTSDAANRMTKNVGDSAEKMRKGQNDELKSMVDNTQGRMRTMVDTTRARGNDMTSSVRRSMGQTDDAVYRGLTYVTDATTKALRAFDAEPIKLTVPKPTERRATGGIIGAWGERGYDDQLVWMGRGEAVLTGHHQPVVDYAMQNTYGIGLPDLFDQVQTPHYMAVGGFTKDLPRFARGGTQQNANKKAKHQVPQNLMQPFDVMGSGPGFVPMMNFLNATVGSGKLVVISGSRPGATVAGSGATSNHSAGNAVDISTPGIRYLSGVSNQLDQAPSVEVKALDATNDYLAKYMAPPIGLDQLYRTAAAGGHWNHVHKGINPKYGQDAQAMIDLIGTLPMGEGVRGIGLGNKPRVKGTEGPMRDIAQGAIDKAFAAARKKVSKQQMKMGSGFGGIGAGPGKGGSIPLPGGTPSWISSINHLWPSAMYPSSEWSALPQLPFKKVAALAEWAGKVAGKPIPGVTMAKVSLGEGNLRPGSRGDDNGDGSPDGYGLWAITRPYGDGFGIDKLGGYEGMNNPVANAILMSRMYPSGGWSGGSPWYGTTHVGGDYNHHYSGPLLKKARGGFNGRRPSFPRLARGRKPQTIGGSVSYPGMRGPKVKLPNWIGNNPGHLQNRDIWDYVQDVIEMETEALKKRHKDLLDKIEQLRKGGVSDKEREQLTEIQRQLHAVNVELRFDKRLKDLGRDLNKMGVGAIDSMQDRINKQIKDLRQGETSRKEKLAIDRLKEVLDEISDELSERAKDLAKLLTRQQAKTSLREGQLQELELRQQLADTYETGGTARAAFIQENILPSLRKERATIRKELRVAEAQGKNALARELRQALQDTTNRILQAQLDKQNLIEENTKEAADRLAEMSGQLSFDYGGQSMTDLLSTGTGV